MENTYPILMFFPFFCHSYKQIHLYTVVLSFVSRPFLTRSLDSRLTLNCLYLSNTIVLHINNEIFFNRNKKYFLKKFPHGKCLMLYIRPSMHNKNSYTFFYFTVINCKYWLQIMYLAWFFCNITLLYMLLNKISHYIFLHWKKITRWRKEGKAA